MNAKTKPAVPKLHVLGEYKDLVQSCTRCGATILDYRRAAWPSDQPPPRGFPTGTEYVIGSGNPRFYLPRSDYNGPMAMCEAPTLADFPEARHDIPCEVCRQKGIVAVMKFHPTSKHGPFYGCERFPECDATHGAHKATGAPMGKPADKPTRQARSATHELFDQLWKGPSAWMSRDGAYLWMQGVLGMTKDEAHIANFDLATCEKLQAAVKARLERRCRPPCITDPGAFKVCRRCGGEYGSEG